MRKLHLISIIIFLISTGCEKESLRSPAPPLPPPPVIVMNTAPKAFAGENIWIVPSDSLTLYGSAYDAENNIVSYSWKKISGPLSYIIENSNSLKTKVRNLEKGTYEFEFTVTDKDGLTGNDTASVFVREPPTQSAGEVIFKDLQWMCVIGCSLSINCISCIVPDGKTFKVFVKRDYSTEWFEVVNESQGQVTDKFSFGIYNNALWIFTDDAKDTPDVKITF
jgi:hypothetical protein